MSELTPDQIFNKYQNGEMDKSTVLNQIKLLIETSPEEALRVDSLKIIQSIGNCSSDLYAFIENLLVSDANPSIRAGAAEVILNNYIDQGIKAIKWAIKKEKSSECLLRIYELIKAKQNRISEELLKDMENSLGKLYIEKCGLNSEEAIYLEILKRSGINIGFIVNARPINESGAEVYFETESGYIVEMSCRNHYYSYPDLNLLKHFKRLKRITLMTLAKVGFEDLLRLPQLEVLILEKCLFRTKEDLKWLEGLVNLKELQLIDTHIEEIPDLSALKNLETLILKPYDYSEIRGNIREITGLENLQSLKELNLRFNRIIEIKGLERLTNLRTLDLSENKIREIKGLENLGNLRRLDIFKNRIKEIKGLNELKNLEFLNLSRNKIRALKNLENLTNLEYLILERNKVSEEELKAILRKLELKRNGKYKRKEGVLTNVLLSIKPKYVEAIKNGNKKYEFRKVLFNKKNINKIEKVYIYSSAPVKRIVARFFVDEILEDHPKKLWEKCKEFSGIDEIDFFNYFGKSEKGLAIKMSEIKFFKNPIEPESIIPNFYPPQSFRYVEDLEEYNNITLYI